MPITVLSAQDIVVSKADTKPCPPGAHIFVRGDLLPLWLWPYCSTSQRLSFVIYKMATVKPTSKKGLLWEFNDMMRINHRMPERVPFIIIMLRMTDHSLILTVDSNLRWNCGGWEVRGLLDHRHIRGDMADMGISENIWIDLPHLVCRTPNPLWMQHLQHSFHCLPLETGHI